MKAIPINMDDYVLSGGGANGESYDHRDDPSVMLKLYFPGKIQQPLDEMLLARKVYDLGIPTPEPGEYVVTPDGRYGIRFHRILGKKSYARAVADNPEKIQQYAEEFARCCTELHRIHVDTNEFENVKERYYRLLEENPFFTPVQKDRIGRFIADAPDTDTAIHGDLQFGNVILKHSTCPSPPPSSSGSALPTPTSEPTGPSATSKKKSVPMPGSRPLSWSATPNALCPSCGRA